MILPDVNVLICAFRRDLPQRAVCRAWLAGVVMMILAATEAIAGVEESIGREALMKGIQTVLSNIADQHLREDPERPTAAFLARTPVCPGPRNEARSDGDRERSGHGQLCGARRR
jgi:hypothetical protein